MKQFYCFLSLLLFLTIPTQAAIQDYIELSANDPLLMNSRTGKISNDRLFQNAPVLNQTNAAVGPIFGEFNVDNNGASNYQIPLKVSPGTANMEPKLALSYNSNNSDGMLGHGWRLEGLSAIHRCAAKNTSTEPAIPIRFTSNDQFCMDGYPLVETEENVYKTQFETFNKITFVPEGQGYFRMIGKDGFTYTFGNDEQSRVVTKGNNQIFAWNVRRIEDNSGNYQTFSYQFDSVTGESVPLRIDYTGNEAAQLTPYNSVVFTYRNKARRIRTFIGGQQLIDNKLLESIVVQHRDDVVYQYNLNYDNNTNASNLTSIEFCGRTGVCLNPTTFTWQVPGFDVEASNVASRSQAQVNSSNLTWLDDFDGNGLSDVGTLLNGQFRVMLNNGNGFDTQEWTLHDASRITSSSNTVTGDFNGDGYFDIATASGSSVYLNLSNGSGFTRAVWSVANAWGSVNWTWAADFNGDGLTDIASASGSNVYMKLSNESGTGFISETWRVANNWGRSDFTWVGEFNGDGVPDIASRTGSTIYLKLSTGEGFDSATRSLTGYSFASAANVRLVDFNSDGLTDIISPHNGAVHIGYATGSGFQSEVWSTASDFSPKSHGYWFVDINNDNLSDLVNYTGDTFQIYISTGQGFQKTDLSAGYVLNSSKVKFSALSGFNVDNIPALLQIDDSGAYLTSFTDASAPLIRQISSGLGEQILVEYRSMKDSEVYTPAGYTPYPLNSAVFLGDLVYQVNNTRASGGTNTFRYHYNDAAYHVGGDTFLGFAQTVNTDQDKNIRTIEQFSRDFDSRLQGKLEVRERYLDDVLLDRVENEWKGESESGLRGEVFSSILQVTKLFKNDLNGNLLYDESTFTTFDEFGNPKVVEEKRSDTNGNIYITESRFDYLTENFTLQNRALPIETRVKRTSIVDGEESVIERRSKWTYTTIGQILTESLEPDNSDGLAYQKRFQYDLFGNVEQELERGDNVPQRQFTYQYDQLGRFLTHETDPLKGLTRYRHDVQTGDLLQTNKNAKAVTNVYDDFGRKIIEIAPTSLVIRTHYKWCDGSCPPGAVYFVETTQKGGATTRVYYDAIGCELRRQIMGWGGRFINVDKVFNELGQVSRVSEPYYEGEQIFWHDKEYDVFDREIRNTNPDGAITRIDYVGLSKITTDALNNSKTDVIDVNGREIENINAEGERIRKYYDAAGQLSRVVNANGDETLIEYNLRGWKTRTVDPDKGTWTYKYNTFGELIQQTNAKGQRTVYVYDQLGRLFRMRDFNSSGRVVADYIHTYNFKIGDPNEGTLMRVWSLDGNFEESYQYDKYSRLIGVETKIGTQTFNRAVSYDQFGRKYEEYDASGKGVRNIYDSNGYLRRVADITAEGKHEDLIYELFDADAHGNHTRVWYGNNITVNKHFDPRTTDLKSIWSSDFRTLNLQYEHDKLGNVTRRIDTGAGKDVDETFAYDRLNRLTRTVSSDGIATNYAYDNLGNLTLKSDVSSANYRYGETCNGIKAGPHAVTSIGAEKFCYDKNGNQISGNGRTIAYSVFDKPVRIVQGNMDVRMMYGPDRARIRKSEFNTQTRDIITTYYVGNVEIHLTREGYEYRRKLIGGITDVVSGTHRTSVPNANNATFYNLKDNLGSTNVVLDSRGNLVEALSYDAFGQSREAQTSQALSSYFDTLGRSVLDIVYRSYTGHEELDSLGLIHMNGRVYDPEIGRFLSADQFVQFHSNVQSFNRYSYVLNNPLSLTDPSGFFSFKKFFKKIFKAVRKIVKKVIRAVKSVVRNVTRAINRIPGLRYVVSTLACGPASPACVAYFNIAFDAVEAWANNVKFKDIAKQAAISFISLKATQIKAYLNRLVLLPRIVSKAVVDGVVNKARGGSFKEGFKRAVSSAVRTEAFVYLYFKAEAITSVTFNGLTLSLNGSATYSKTKDLVSGRVYQGFEQGTSWLQGDIPAIRWGNNAIAFENGSLTYSYQEDQNWGDVIVNARLSPTRNQRQQRAHQSREVFGAQVAPVRLLAQGVAAARGSIRVREGINPN